MRIVLTLTAILIACGLFLGAGSRPAGAAPLPSVAALDPSSAVETIGWRRRYYRRYDTLPLAPPPVVVDEDVLVETDEIIVVPLRPASCGEFRYWNGMACVDARYNTPYLGPR